MLIYNGSHLPTKKQHLLGILAVLLWWGIVILGIYFLVVFSKFGDWLAFWALVGGFAGGVVVCWLSSFISKFNS